MPSAIRIIDGFEKCPISALCGVPRHCGVRSRMLSAILIIESDSALLFPMENPRMIASRNFAYPPYVHFLPRGRKRTNRRRPCPAPPCASSVRPEHAETRPAFAKATAGLRQVRALFPVRSSDARRGTKGFKTITPRGISVPVGSDAKQAVLRVNSRMPFHDVDCDERVSP